MLLKYFLEDFDNLKDKTKQLIFSISQKGGHHEVFGQTKKGGHHEVFGQTKKKTKKNPMTLNKFIGLFLETVNEKWEMTCQIYGATG